ncbi:uncharacterized protein LOC124911346 [Impatiens glandulifera]|uniref:uncharacterized protein LOC124911346 n=1 Tax=Impatiens glandulifera TaxID=253017 RepID=UPI001FB18F36|nr:uncharacterized protein LOC124911346 [Impatiens glandulifera]
MKDFSLLNLNNSFGAKMRRGLKGSCNGDASTSTLNQRVYSTDGQSIDHPVYDFPKVERQKTVAPTLEEMILELDLEERAAARRAKIDQDERRMSCVNFNNSDILRSARNAMLNQYPRFSLDGKDAMYRSSFVRNKNQNVPCFATRSRFVGGERVVWCKPGVVARLMGLDAVPVPVNNGIWRNKEKAAVVVKTRNNLLYGGTRRRENVCDHGYCAVGLANGEEEAEVGWPMRGRNF